MLCAGWAKDIDAVMLTYNLMKYNDTYSKKSGTLWQYYRHELIKDDAGLITHLTAVVNSNALKFKKNYRQSSQQWHNRYKATIKPSK